MPGNSPRIFSFQLTEEEFEALRSQNATSKLGRGGRRYRPFAFTDYGAIQAANVLNSPAATAMSIYVVRSFTQMREALLNSAVILKKLAEIDRTLLETQRRLACHLAPAANPPAATARV